MLHIRYVTVFAFLAASGLAQQYEYQTGGQSATRPAPARVQPGYSGPAAPKPTPIAILKQINRHNEDGSYTYGYEGADGSFKIETKLPTGEVKGKYGYVDDTGKVRVVEYGATKYGFEPSGEGITVAPPTLVDETTNKDGTLNPEYQDQYYEPAPAPVRAAAPAPRPAPRPRPQPSYESFSAPQQFAPIQQQASPVPQRATIAGAAPITTDFEFGPPSRQSPRNFATAQTRPQQTFSFANAAPVEEQNYVEPSRPKITYAQPAQQPQYATQFAPAPRPAPAAPQYTPRTNTVTRQSGGGVLDQLAKDYALPQGGAAPLHDISFGYY